MKKHVSWEEIIKMYDSFEQRLVEDVSDQSLKSFFSQTMEIFRNNKFEPWQIEEAKGRLAKIIDTLNSIKEEVEAEKISLLDKSKQFDKYIKNSHIRK